MKIAIDTSSLISLVRYYLPFDKNGTLDKFIRHKIESKDIVVLDKVYEECKYTSKGIVVTTLKYLTDKKCHVNTTDLLPEKKFFNQLENQFINGSIKAKLTGEEFEVRKSAFLDSADCKLLLFGLKHQGEGIIIVSEETDTGNDNKSFKKIPAICNILSLECITLPLFLKRHPEIDIEFK